MSATAIALLWMIYAFFVGAVVGSFLNMCIHRIPRSRFLREESFVCPHCGQEVEAVDCPHCGKEIRDEDEEALAPSKSMGSKRSRCPRCGALIRFYDNIPIFSWIILRGKCRDCKAPIPMRYPLVELLSGLFGLACFIAYGPSLAAVAYFIFLAALVCVSFIDLDVFRIPLFITLPGAFLGICVSPWLPGLGIASSVLGMLCGAGGIYLLRRAYFLLRGAEGMGGGDVDLMAMIGAFLGWQGALFAAVAAAFTGTVAGLVLMAFQKKGLKTRLPFGPFLALGAMLYLFWGGPLTAWYLGLFAGIR
ncbi:MAG: A24 family peptidase [Thermodesulfobacteriota bacterium]